MDDSQSNRDGTADATESNLAAAASELFPDEHPIFADKQLLQIGHIPDGDRIVGRESEIRSLADQLVDATDGNSPENVIVYGKPGTGKSLVSKYVTQLTGVKAQSSGHDVATAYIECNEDNTETQAVATIGQTLNREGSGVSIPDTGLSTSRYYKRLWELLDAEYDTVIVILDEVDLLDDDSILMELSRAEEAEKTTCNVGIIAISNKTKFVENLGQRTTSSLQETELFFPPYDAEQLQAILRNRADAFRDGVLEDGVIELCAALAAREHGDARKALDILRNAGKIAYEHDDDRVTETHVRNAQDRAEVDRFREMIADSTVHAQAVILSLALLTQHGDGDTFTSGDLVPVYEFVCTQCDFDPLTERRLRDILKEQDFLDIIESTKRSRGHARGIGREHRLIDEAEIVRETILSDSRFSDLFADISEDQFAKALGRS